uniref:Uncharacterized protein n=1 Tax=Arundo donax TaxID=35708 RepID=A0A0A9E897_ARUDO
MARRRHALQHTTLSSSGMTLPRNLSRWEQKPEEVWKEVRRTQRGERERRENGEWRAEGSEPRAAAAVRSIEK